MINLKTLKFLIKIYSVLLIYILLYGFIYSLYISKTGNNINIIVSLSFNAVSTLLLGFGYSNHFQKRGLIIGLLITLLHISLIKVIYYFSTNKIDLNALKISIITLTGGIGGIIGTNIKKIF